MVNFEDGKISVQQLQSDNQYDQTNGNKEIVTFEDGEISVQQIQSDNR